MTKYRVMIWIKNSRKILTSKLFNTDDKMQTKKDWILTKDDISVLLVISDNKVDVIPVNRIEKIRVKFYEKE
jgi:hypothetical protein